MKIKAKLTFSLGVLFAMVVLLMAMSIFFINRLSGDTRNILVANYNTIDYAHTMQAALDNGIGDTSNVRLFNNSLSLQQKNITEPGERELTDSLLIHFSQLQKAANDSAMVRLARSDLSAIMQLNMEAIQRKSGIAANTADQAVLWVSIIGTICFLAAFTLLVNVPGNIANPVKQLAESIRQIAAQNYSQRIHFDQQNEFGDLANSFNSMAEKLQEYQASSLQKLMIEKKRIEALINNMHDPVIGLDEHHRILFMNDVALKIAGLSAADAVGKPVQDVAIRNDLVRSLVQDLFAQDDDAVTSRLPVKIYADDKESYFEKEIIPINIIPTGEKNERLIGNVILLQNITPYKELDFAKTNFIATVSHELKTPISSIQMSLQLLENRQMGTLNDEQQILVVSIGEDATRLLKITGELLNMAQVETGTMQLSIQPADPKAIVMDAVSSNKTVADNKQIQLQVSIPDELPLVLCDQDKTAWVLTNFISNAIRYSYENAAIDIKVQQEGKQLLFSVSDSGQGIPPQYIHKIFNRYFRIPGTQKEGTGLGLSISKEFMEAQQGSITVESDYGSGTTFTFSLPVVG